jgi:Fic family protein
MPYQRRWVDALQTVQLKREVNGTSRIEGADFTEKELEAALKETPEQLLSRSQRQAHCVAKAYRWIRTVPDDKPVTREMILDIHRLIVLGADDDHCPPGETRKPDVNVTFGSPRHRGVDGGKECEQAFAKLCSALSGEFNRHEPLVKALALHYHFASMHPFVDGNGRTARVLEALMLQRAGLKDSLFIAMSNYYYDEKAGYLSALGAVRSKGQDLTPFLAFGLKGISQQCRRLRNEIKIQVEKSLFRNLMYDLFNRLHTPKKRVIAKRQVEVLKIMLDSEEMTLDELQTTTDSFYKGLNNPRRALIRDVNELLRLGTISAHRLEDGSYMLAIKLDWPTKMTETAFFEKIKTLPTAKADGILCPVTSNTEEEAPASMI